MFGSMDIRVQSSHKCHTTQNGYKEASPSDCSPRIAYTWWQFPDIIPFRPPPDQNAASSKSWALINANLNESV